MRVGGGAGGSVIGLGAVEVDGSAVVPAMVGATWVVVVVLVVVLVVVAVVDTKGPPWANALHTPEALSCGRTQTPHPECGGNASPGSETPKSGWDSYWLLLKKR
ncbi:hypothetical protein NDU88_006600 [Pleurodeles waltl]|uniref:Uncharacterized protein n=1 Tax=Pleurodeles waltl TaxID=8319 RepID=A0AAV7VMC5_PLEWA|nr:hypothetical protein NDU88_006600 [Pleurodeles waltl]